MTVLFLSFRQCLIAMLLSYETEFYFDTLYFTLSISMSILYLLFAQPFLVSPLEDIVIWRHPKWIDIWILAIFCKQN